MHKILFILIKGFVLIIEPVSFLILICIAVITVMINFHIGSKGKTGLGIFLNVNPLKLGLVDPGVSTSIILYAILSKEAL